MKTINLWNTNFYYLAASKTNQKKKKNTASSSQLHKKIILSLDEFSFSKNQNTTWQINKQKGT